MERWNVFVKKDARGAELKRGGIKGSIRIGPRRRISCVIRGEPPLLSSPSWKGEKGKGMRRGTEDGACEEPSRGEKSHPLCCATSSIQEEKEIQYFDYRVSTNGDKFLSLSFLFPLSSSIFKIDGVVFKSSTILERARLFQTPLYSTFWLSRDVPLWTISRANPDLLSQIFLQIFLSIP